jgi:hypothetical protein
MTPGYPAPGVGFFDPAQGSLSHFHNELRPPAAVNKWYMFFSKTMLL